MSGESVEVLTTGDVSWMADVMVDRRALYETYSSLFWHPATNARAIHEPHLASCVASDRYVGFRTAYGFVIGELQPAGSPPWWPEAPIGFIDDFAVVADHMWVRDGRALLRAAWSRLRELGAEGLRVVTARRDDAKVGMLESLGLDLGESWCVRAVDGPRSGTPTLGPVSADRIEGLLIPAPPVYDPGGPVLLVTSVASADDVRQVAGLAAEHGAVLAIVPTKPEAPDVMGAALACGFDETSRYYVGRPAES